MITLSLSGTNRDDLKQTGHPPPPPPRGQTQSHSCLPNLKRLLLAFCIRTSTIYITNFPLKLILYSPPPPPMKVWASYLQRGRATCVIPRKSTCGWGEKTDQVQQSQNSTLPQIAGLLPQSSHEETERGGQSHIDTHL